MPSCGGSICMEPGPLGPGRPGLEPSTAPCQRLALALRLGLSGLSTLTFNLNRRGCWSRCDNRAVLQAPDHLPQVGVERAVELLLEDAVALSTSSRAFWYIAERISDDEREETLSTSRLQLSRMSERSSASASARSGAISSLKVMMGR